MEYSLLIFVGGAGGGSPPARRVWWRGGGGLAVALLRGFCGGEGPRLGGAQPLREGREAGRVPKDPGKPRNPTTFDCCSVACWCERRVSRPSRTIPGSAHHRRTTNKKKKTTPTSSTLGLPLKHTRFDCKTNCVRCHPCFLVVRFDTYCERTRGCGGRWRRRHVEGVQH